MGQEETRGVSAESSSTDGGSCTPELMLDERVQQLLDKISRYERRNFADTDDHPANNAARRFARTHPKLAKEVASYIPRVAKALETMLEEQTTQPETPSHADDESVPDMHEPPEQEHAPHNADEKDPVDVESERALLTRAQELGDALRGLDAALADRDPNFRTLLPPNMLGSLYRIDEAVAAAKSTHDYTALARTVTLITSALAEYGRERPRGPIRDSRENLARINFHVKNAGEVALSITRGLGATKDAKLNELAPSFRNLTDRLSNMVRFNHQLMGLFDQYQGRRQ